MDVHRLASASVVVGVDGSAGADLALDWAAGLAAQRERELHIVCGLGLAPARRGSSRYAAWLDSVQHGLRAKGAAIVERARYRALAAEPGSRVSTEVSDATPAGVLVRHSAEAYLVVMGAVGASGFAAHVGSVVLRVVAHGQGTIVVVRADSSAGDQLPGGGPVVVGVDGSRAGEAAVGVAFEEAAERDTGLLAVYACHDLNSGLYAADPYVLYSVPEIEVSEHAVLAERLAGWHGKYPDVPVTRQVLMSDPVTALLDSAKSAQLLVVGSRGRDGFLGALLGSTSNSLVQHAQCPVMVVHPPKQ
ncbi:universal stress protein [Nocardia vaccinii]|uniref:universal stress protein n=1 Tax=Nocardia vaccinii TaxID=1822 RepID=UPI00083432D4|nr:universal stress protein [Nocardia vaccinii]